MAMPGAADLLAAIVAAAQARVRTASSERPSARLETAAAARPATTSLSGALSAPGLRVIAECKRRSPSRGILRHDYDPVAIARGYARAGAAAISVLTEPGFFDGALEHLEAVRADVQLPLLRKDFIIDPYQVLEARAAGADAVLLIVAALDRTGLVRLLAEAGALGLEALVEVHDDHELDRALDAGASLIGVNNRNLKTLAVDRLAADRLAARIPDTVVSVAESGLRTKEDLLRLQAVGYSGFLVGERLVTAADPAQALATLLGAEVAP
jgi:indole-3-glycerol phosphate synthase